ncbi:prohibitin family protein [Anabaena cylindrica FACHB-243]|uniref:Band 7 protein n=1 Tax=Anabaena cylindrica (strain ATCC 27899 / PCC 7122) TaxID=272123 RepID=K9ZDX9_ANACC|nr:MULTISPECIES: prohibitin family protein [Anabaena]AFZ56787.1 band 7 protein [Anabaena cylindrica PCC 7122]MBD2418581.1 prohibitin family protein [Anabaena cylindrica FACHB-243]MBY5283593.1 prohibitin family protein [Anabaena sp. CCAP 1446/1C]MBY5311307.1 prohibitin family protein [Anabaena sp. CCAP 1446/1C]MCM2409327.1 prohibitin family protein [Anabaena sp. CCAP 1446/1C]
MKKHNTFNNAGKLTALLCLLTLLLTPFVIVNAGERGVLMQFGHVQEQILGEGIHLIIPVVNTVKRISIRIQKQEISAEAASKDLQNVFIDVALNWHILPDKANTIFQQIGDTNNIIESIINPAIEEVLKSVIAQYTAEEVITKRANVKIQLDQALTTKLGSYNIAFDDIFLVHIRFSEKFREAVESKQIAAQEAKRAEFIALKAVKEAEVKVNLAKGEAEAQSLLRNILTPQLLQRQAIEKWNGRLPLIIGKDNLKLGNIQELITAGEN